jgi:hypothetical protein
MASRQSGKQIDLALKDYFQLIPKIYKIFAHWDRIFTVELDPQIDIARLFFEVVVHLGSKSMERFHVIGFAHLQKLLSTAQNVSFKLISTQVVFLPERIVSRFNKGNRSTRELKKCGI